MKNDLYPSWDSATEFLKKLIRDSDGWIISFDKQSCQLNITLDFWNYIERASNIGSIPSLYFGTLSHLATMAAREFTDKLDLDEFMSKPVNDRLILMVEEQLHRIEQDRIRFGKRSLKETLELYVINGGDPNPLKNLDIKISSTKTL